MGRFGILLGVLLTIPMAPASQAQVTVDVAKITCEQMMGGPEELVAIGLWLSGYYNAKRNNTVVDVSQLRKNAEAVAQHCMQNPKTPVMQAVETVLK